MTALCRHCGRAIILEGGIWINPEATGDDSVWRECCEDHETFTAEHEPETEEDRALMGKPNLKTGCTNE